MPQVCHASSMETPRFFGVLGIAATAFIVVAIGSAKTWSGQCTSSLPFEIGIDGLGRAQLIGPADAPLVDPDEPAPPTWRPVTENLIVSK